MSHPTERLRDQADRLIAYCAAYPSNELVFKASDMIVTIESDASYLSRSKARSVVGGIHYMGNLDDSTFINGGVAVESSILDCVAASVAEAEYGAAFKNAQKGVWTRTIAEALGHQQPPTPIYVDNKCAEGLANDTVKIKRAKSLDMRFHWLRDRVRQGQFIVKWRQGSINLADFFTKAQPVHVHQNFMKRLIRVPITGKSHFISSRGRRGNAWKARARTA